MPFVTQVLPFCFAVFAGMLLAFEAGRWIGVRRRREEEEPGRIGASAIDAAIFALLGLLVAFTFSSAASRFEARRGLIVQEVNAIGTAYLRVDLLPAADQPAIRDAFRRYMDSRIEQVAEITNLEVEKSEYARSQAIQSEIWGLATAACARSGGAAPGVVVFPALNAMFDLATSRLLAAQTHQPGIILLSLVALTLLAAGIAGFEMAGAKRRSWVHVIGFSLALTLTLYVILDLEYPRTGLIRIDALDHAMVELRQSMK